MARKSSKKTAVVMSGVLYAENPDITGIKIGSDEWFKWLETGETFYLDESGYTVRAEKRRQGLSWYAFKKVDGKLTKKYVGRTAGVTLAKLNELRT
jgi:LuxR family maltose regulon positive regulatory protein